MAQPTPNDIVIRLHLADHDAVTGKALVQALDSLETALYSSDREDVLELSAELRLPAVARDAALERLRNYRNLRLQFYDARQGSLTLFAIVTGVTLFVLDKTIGESVGEAFKDTDTHRKLRVLFSQRIELKALRVGEGIRHAFASKRRKVEV